MAKSEKQNSGGMSFDVVFKPASGEGVPPVTPRGQRMGLTRERSCLSQSDIDRKLKEAEELKKAKEQAQLEKLRKHEEHAEQVRQKKRLSTSEESKK